MRKYSIAILNRENLELKGVSFLKLMGFSTLLLLIGFIGGSLTRHPNEIEKMVYDQKVIVEKFNEEFSEANLRKMLTRLKVKHIDIVMAQARIETGNYKSSVFLENNNLFGMKQSQSRVTTAIGTNLNHAMYQTWQESVIDYAIYQSTYLRKFNDEQYLGYLQENYAEDSNYVNLIQQIRR